MYRRTISESNCHDDSFSIPFPSLPQNSSKNDTAPPPFKLHFTEMLLDFFRAHRHQWLANAHDTHGIRTLSIS